MSHLSSIYYYPVKAFPPIEIGSVHLKAGEGLPDDRRYAINPSRIGEELGWAPSENFQSGLRRTVQWYLDHEEWIKNIEDGSYRGERLGNL